MGKSRLLHFILRPDVQQHYLDDAAVPVLLVLADALEDAGCADDSMVAHLRTPGPHVRGCWVVDQLLCPAR